VYERDEDEIQWLKELKIPKVGFLKPHRIGLQFELLKKANAVEELCKKSSALIKYINSDDVKHTTDPKNSGRYPPIIFVGLGFAALVTMKAVLSEQLIPMGIVVSSVFKDSAVGRSAEFKTWYENLTELAKKEDEKEELAKKREEELAMKEEVELSNKKKEQEREKKEKEKKEKEKKKETKKKDEPATENSDLSKLMGLLCDFNEYCRRERVRFSYILQREEVNGHGLLSKWLLY
jgi:hypothetical protein